MDGYLGNVSEDVGTTGAAQATAFTDMASLLAEQTRELRPEAVIANRYRVDRLLGTGGMADVVLATDVVLDRQVAVKLLRETADTKDDLARFLAETRTLAQLSHPGLVTVLDGGTTLNRPFLVMELVDGPPLSASLEAPLVPVRAAEIGAQVAAALAYVHAQGVVHRDVKPGNVLLRRDGRVKLADFGIAKLLGDHSGQTRTGTVVGSVHYLAPEQVAFEEISPAVDVYALGLLLLRTLTGRHAFEGTTVESALARLSADPEIPADLPSGWRELLTAMTARNPEDRPSAADVAGRLAWLSGARRTARVLPPAPLASSVSATTPAREAVRNVRRRLVGALSAVSLSPVLVGAVLLAVLLFVSAAMAGGKLGSPSDDPVADPSTSEQGSGSATGSQPVVGPDGPLEPVDPVSETVVAAADIQAASASGSKSQKAGKNDKSKQHKGKHKPGKGKPGKGKPGKGKK